MKDPNLPLIDLHRHLDGSVRLSTILDLGLSNQLALPANTLDDLKEFVQVTEPQPGILKFFEKFKWQVGILVDYEACRRIATENVLDAVDEGIDYIELRFSPWFMAEPHGLDPASVCAAVVEGVAEACRQHRGIKVNLLGILSRTYGVETAMLELEALMSQRQAIVGLDLAGDEINFPARLFKPHFDMARNSGWHVTIHAGEAAGPESVWEAIELLGAERIGHAIAISEDEALMDFMLENKIGIETNLTSNYQTSTINSYAAHPLKGWLDKGLLATINTDDPGISAINLAYEYEVAAPQAGLSQADIQKAQANALKIAFLSDDEKEQLKNR